MKKPLPIDPEERLFSLGDLGRLYRKHKKKILRAALLFAGIAFLVALNRPVQYEITATFKEGIEQKGSDGISSALGRIGVVVDSDPQVNALMKSYQVLRPLVEKMGLQVSVGGSGILSRGMRCLFNHVGAELRCSLPDFDSFRFTDVSYEDEMPFFLQLYFLDCDTFEVHYNGSCIATYHLGEKIDLEKASFRVVRTPSNLKLHSSYPLTVESWKELADRLRDQLKIKAHKTNKAIYDLSILYQDRHFGVEILNDLMTQYQAYLKRDHDQVAKAQLVYLENRQGYLNDRLDRTLKEHGGYLYQNVQENGFLSIDQEAQFFREPHADLYKRALVAELEIEELSLSPSLHDVGLGTDLYQLRQTIQDLEHQRDLVQVALAEESTSEHLAAMGELPLDLKLTYDPEVGLDLETVKQLLVNASQQLDHSKAILLRYRYFMHLVEDPSCEVGSLLSVLSDPASQRCLELASNLYLQLQDKDHYSDKEEERLVRELDFQRKILGEHLQQMIAIEELNAILHQNKIVSLQRICLDCINRQISVRETQIAMLTGKRREGLMREKRLFEQRMGELRDQMAHAFPDKWRLEKLLNFKTAMSLRTMQSVANLVESKTIGHHLHHIESKPLDYAIIPRLPKKPHLLLFLSAGMLLGALGAFFGAFFRALYRGFPVSPTTLEKLHYPFSGCISFHADGPKVEHLFEEDLESLRKLILKIDEPPVGSLISLLGNTGPDYSHSIADLLAQSGRKILLVRCDFSSKFSSKDTPGLLQMLRGSHPVAPIRKENGYDLLPSGGHSRYGTELIRSNLFADCLERWKKNYDHVLLLCRAPLHSAQCEVMLRFSDRALVTIVEESIESLTPLIQWAYDEERCRLTFLCVK